MDALTRCCLGISMMLSLAAPVLAQEPKSAAPAKELAAAMSAAKITAVAAEDGDQPDGFVAVLAYPGALLVVSAKYAPASLLKERVQKKDYQEVYMDLQSASVAGSKVFVSDIGADGLRVKSADSVDAAGKSLAFDGDWRKSKLPSEDDYNKALSDADEAYTKMLTRLLEGMKKTS